MTRLGRGRRNIDGTARERCQVAADRESTRAFKLARLSGQHLSWLACGELRSRVMARSTEAAINAWYGDAAACLLRKVTQANDPRAGVRGRVTRTNARAACARVYTGELRTLCRVRLRVEVFGIPL